MILEITREGGEGEGMRFPPIPASITFLHLLLSSPLLCHVIHSQIVLTSPSHCPIPVLEKYHGLQRYFCMSFSFTGLNVIREAVFWLQIKPLITTKVCEYIHVETPLKNP